MGSEHPGILIVYANQYEALATVFAVNNKSPLFLTKVPVYSVAPHEIVIG